MRNRNAGSDPKIRTGEEPEARKERESRTSDALRKLLKKKFETVGSAAEQETTGESGPGRKMSEVLLAFIEPYLYLAENREMLDRLVATAAAASLLPEDKREGFLGEAGRIILAEAGKQAADDFRPIMRDLIARKQRLFSRDERVVVQYELRRVGGRDQLVVASARGDARDSKESDQPADSG